MPVLATDVEIANFSLQAHLGKPGIVSFTQTGSPEATKCKTFYPVAREFVATRSDWSFLRERAALAVVTNDRDGFWDVAYDVPSRALKLFYLVDPYRAKTPYRDYDLGGGKIYTNLTGAYAHYVTLDGSDVSDWPLKFKLAIAAKLSEFLSPSMTRKPSDVEKFRVMAEQDINKAIEEDAGSEYVRYAQDESYVWGTVDHIPGREYDGSSFWR